ASQSGALDPVQSDRQRLDHRAQPRIDAGGQLEEAARAAHHVLGVGARKLAQAETADILAVDPLPLAAELAGSATDVRQRSHTLALGIAADARTELDDFAAELMAHHRSRPQPEAVLHGMEIGAADAAGMNLEHDLAGAGLGPRQVNDFEFVRALVDDRLH